MKERNRQFAQLDDFLIHYKPMSPYGREHKRTETFIKDILVLNRDFDRIEQFIRFIGESGPEADKIEYHLSRIPKLVTPVSRGELRSEIFNVKKFLHNYRAIAEQLTTQLKGFFSFDYDTTMLLDKLGYKEGQEESFYIDGNYSDELSALRQSLRKIDSELKEIRDRRVEYILSRCSLDFRFYDFLIIEESSIPVDCDNLVFIEPWDNSSVKVKPSLGKEYYQLHNSAGVFLDREKKLEMKILGQLSDAIEKERKALDKAVEAVKAVDISLAKARLAIKFRCVRPLIKEEGFLKVDSLRFLPLEELCRGKRVDYTPLSARFDKPNIVISGSNMGGKTVVLKTVLFAQLLVQYGFYVPAESVETQIYANINLIGASFEEGVSGLSSFGEEIMGLIQSKSEGRSLFLIDEFARTTNSYEAYGLNCALLESFSRNRDIRSFSSTHQDNLPPFENTSFWTMKGLDYEKYKKYFHSDYRGDLNERIALINSFMDYSLIRRSRTTTGRDALKIADILGLDGEIIVNAEKYMNLQEK